jgi:hypothetical protein
MRFHLTNWFTQDSRDWWSAEGRVLDITVGPFILTIAFAKRTAEPK